MLAAFSLTGVINDETMITLKSRQKLLTCWRAKSLKIIAEVKFLQAGCNSQPKEVNYDLKCITLKFLCSLYYNHFYKLYLFTFAITTNGQSNLAYKTASPPQMDGSIVSPGGANVPHMWVHWRHLANTIELVLPSANPSPQPKRQIDRFSRFCRAH